MKKLIIIPAYNEEKNILNVISDIKTKCQGYDYIVVNDCSKDQTNKLLYDNNCFFIDLKCNLGIGGAVQAGYIYASENGYDIAVQIDGDGQHDVSYICNVVEPLENGEADICIGSRFIKKQGFQSTVIRRSGILFLSSLIKILTGNKIYDVTSGFRAINKKMIEIYSRDYPQDYPEPEAIVMALKHGAIIKEVPVTMKKRQGGISSINIRRSIYYMIKVSLACLIAKLQ